MGRHLLPGLTLTAARTGYTFANKKYPDNPKAIPTQTQRTMGTGMIQRSCLRERRSKTSSDLRVDTQKNLQIRGSRQTGCTQRSPPPLLHSTRIHQGTLKQARGERASRFHRRRRVKPRWKAFESRRQMDCQTDRMLLIPLMERRRRGRI